jgi:hypothetical protein
MMLHDSKLRLATHCRLMPVPQPLTGRHRPVGFNFPGPALRRRAGSADCYFRVASDSESCFYREYPPDLLESCGHNE